MYKTVAKIFFILIIFLSIPVFAFESKPFDLSDNTSAYGDTNKNDENEDFQKKTIRVLLSGYNSSSVTVSSKDELYVTSGDKIILTANSPVTVGIDGDYLVVRSKGLIEKILLNDKILISTNKEPLTADNITKAGNPASYKGQLEVSAKNNKIRLINILDVEDYIKGVVPNEMPVYFGLEALKAQAVSARGYAYRDVSLKSENYDVCDTTGSQVYNGYSTYDPISNKAVDETRGQFALYDGKVILSLYSSTAGGHTENYENVFSQNYGEIKFPGKPVPYLKGVPDYDYDLDLSVEENAKRFYENKPPAFDMKSPKYRWEYIWNIEELENILANNFVKYASSPFVTPKIKSAKEFGKILSIDVPQRGVSGKAMYVRIVTDKNVFLVAKEIMIRQIFLYEKKWLPSANITFENLYDINNNLHGIKVVGGGFGHGVGLSQYGAASLASKGYTYDQILKHYYTGITIGSYPVECNLKNVVNCKTTFYSKDKNVKLHVSVQTPSDLLFKINDSHVLISSQQFNSKTEQIDIQKWIKKGVNTIELKSFDKNKVKIRDNKIKFYAELATNEK